MHHELFNSQFARRKGSYHDALHVKRNTLVLFLVSTLGGQHTLSALTVASLFVAVGVSADNLFVVHETWRQSRLLTVDGARASRTARVWWTMRVAGHPLAVADLTTAFALFINCLSPITGPQ